MNAATVDTDVDTRANPCPECPEGEVVSAGPTESGGHQPVQCSVRCGWSFL